MLMAFGRTVAQRFARFTGLTKTAKRRREASRRGGMPQAAEYLEPRVLPVSITTNPDVYNTSKDTALVVATADGVTQSTISCIGGQCTGGDELQNDSGDDPDNPPTFVVSKESDPSHGTLNYVNSDGSFKYTPDAGWAGTDTWTYRVTAQPTSIYSATAVETVKIYVHPNGTAYIEKSGTSNIAWHERTDTYTWTYPSVGSPYWQMTSTPVDDVWNLGSVKAKLSGTWEEDSGGSRHFTSVLLNTQDTSITDPFLSPYWDTAVNVTSSLGDADTVGNDEFVTAQVTFKVAIASDFNVTATAGIEKDLGNGYTGSVSASTTIVSTTDLKASISVSMVLKIGTDGSAQRWIWISDTQFGSVDNDDWDPSQPVAFVPGWTEDRHRKWLSADGVTGAP